MKLFVSLAIVVGTLAVPAIAMADDPAAGCPAGKDLLTVRQTLRRVDFSIYTRQDAKVVSALIAGLDTDGNNDGYLCSTQFKPNTGQDKQWGATDYVITQISDNQPTGRL